MMFSRQPVEVVVPDPAQDALLRREAHLRFAGEVLLLLAIIGYLMIDFFTTDPFGIQNFRGLIHLPDELAKHYKFDRPALHVTTNTNDRYATPGFVSILLVASVIGAILRGRWLITRFYLAFFILPLPLVGIPLGVIGFLTSVILIAWTYLALKKRKFVYATLAVVSLFSVWSYFGWLSDFGTSVSRPYTFIRSPSDPGTNARAGQLTPSSQFKTFEESVGETVRASRPKPEVRKLNILDKLENWKISPDLEQEFSYAMAQDAAIRGDKDFVRKYLAPVESKYTNAESYEYKRIHALKSYISDQTSNPFMWQRLLGIVGFGFVVLMMMGGIGLQTLAGKIVKRTQRLEILKANLPEPSNPAITSAPQIPTRDIAHVIKDALTFRLRLAATISIGLFFLSGALFWLMRQAAHASGSRGESLIHIPRQAFQAFPNGFAGVTWAQYDAPSMPLLTLLLPYVIDLFIIFLLLKRHYRLFSIMAVIVIVWQGHIFLSPQTKGMVEIPLTAIKPSVFTQMELVAAKSIDQADEPAEAAKYILAQRAYLVKDADELSERLRGMSNSPLRKLNSVEWRYTVMTDWLSEQSTAASVETRLSTFMHAYRWLSNSLLSVSASVLGLAILFAALASGFAWRGYRLNRFIQAMHQAKASQRIKGSLTATGQS